MDEKQKQILSFGGGLNSSALLVFLVERGEKIDKVVFADTGSELPYTYEAVEFYQNYCAEHNILFSILKSEKGNIYDYYFNKKALPSRMKRDCTSKFKVQVIRAHLREEYGKAEIFRMFIGIDFGELRRMRTSNVKYIENVYPLVQAKIDRDGCKRLLLERKLLVPEKSGCFFCPFTRKGNWLRLLRENPELFERAVALEKNCSKFPKFLLNMKPLEMFKENPAQTHFKDFEATCDVSGSCFL